MTDHFSHGEQLLEINKVELCVETFGKPANPAILLIDGPTASSCGGKPSCAIGSRGASGS